MAVKKTQTAKKTTTRKRKPAAKKKQTESFIVKTQKTINDGRTRLLLAGLTFFLALIVFLAFISYLISWEGDQSQLDFSNPDVEVNNLAGKLGASLAHLFIYDWFGIASFSIVLILSVIGLHLFNIKFIPLGKTIKYSIIATIWLSVSLSFIFGAEYLVLGGAHGYYLSDLLVSFLGITGTAFLLFILLAAFILFTFENSYIWLINVFGGEDKKEVEAVKVAVNQQYEEDDQDEVNEGPLSLGTNINLDTNELIETVDRKHLLIHDNGKVENKEDLGFEVENTIKENENKNTSNNETKEGLVLDVEKNEDIQAEEFDEEPYDPTLELSNYKFPPIELLDDHRAVDSEVTKDELLQNKNKIVETLKHYKIEITKIKATIGPTITLYEIVPAPGVRISKIKNLEDDIALSLAALGIRIIAPMPGRGTIGIEVPNQNPEIVSMRSVISSLKFQESKYDLPVVLGKTISNESFVIDLAKMPHLLVAGATGQGKSVGLNAIIASLLYKKHPAEVKFIFVDPKKVELTLYEKIEKHFLAKLPESEDAIITDNAQVINTLNSMSKEMDSRYNLLKLASVRNIKEYNQKFINRKLNPMKGHRFLPYLVLVIDEFADLIMTAGKEVEMPIARLAQLARAIGMHLIVATQRPSTNIITGTIKANFPARIAFKVASMIDSRTILDTPGANQLIGRGDMLISEGSDITRLQCAFIDTPELDKITSYISQQQAYTSAYILPEPDSDEDSGVNDIDLSKKDDLFEDAARMVVLHQQGSTSLIQRKLSIGYNRAGRIIDQLEAAGIVGAFEGSKARQVLMPDEYALEQFLKTI
ncbi:MAG: DNA translocase FtsK [Bacteroidota bacterium]